jgi:hypothetical protein
VVAIEIVDRTLPGDRVVVLDAAGLRAAAAAGLASAFAVSGDERRDSGAAVPSGAAETWRCRLEAAASLRDAGSEGMVRAAVAGRCSRTDLPDALVLEAQVLADRTYRPGEAGTSDREALVRAHLERAVGDVARNLAAQQQLRTGDVRALQAALADPDANRRRQAVRVAADRRAKECVPALLERLRDPEEDIRDGALGALVEIGDPSAVGPLVRNVPFRDTEGMRKILDAVATLGGPEAMAYLELVSGSHADADVREIAAQALSRLKRRTARPTAR